MLNSAPRQMAEMQKQNKYKLILHKYLYICIYIYFKGKYNLMTILHLKGKRYQLGHLGTISDKNGKLGTRTFRSNLR